VKQNFLSDPKARTAYLATKVIVFGIAAVATWPLSQIFGRRAWVGLAVFGGILAIMAIVVLAVASKGNGVDSGQERDAESEEDRDPEEPIQLELEDSIDLHSFPPKDVPDVVDAYLESVADKGFTEVRLIHGRGIGVQRDRVQKLLARHRLVSGFHDAPPERGGWGATIAYLRPRS